MRLHTSLKISLKVAYFLILPSALLYLSYVCMPNKGPEE